MQNILDTMPELTGRNRGKLLSAIQNETLRKIAKELYRLGATIGDGGTGASLLMNSVEVLLSIYKRQMWERFN